MKSRSIFIIKFTFLFLLLGLQKNTLASHAVGGEITYEFLSNSFGTSTNYLVKLKLYRNVIGINYATTQTITVSSFCYPTQSYTLTMPIGHSGNVIIDDFKNCTDSSTAVDDMSYYLYTKEISLPGPCTDYKFSWSMCCRNTNITNLASNENLYLEAKLNNTLGPNSSPEFVKQGVKLFCVLQEAYWSNNAIEQDGDSLYFQLAQPLADSITGVTWASGYNTLNPITSAFGVNFDHANGLMSFIPTQPEVDALRIVVSEFRYDTVSNRYLQIGEISRDAQIVISNSCVSTNLDSLVLQLKNPVSGNKSEIPCNTQRLEFKLDFEVLCSSIAPDGSDFAILDSYGYLMPIQEAGSQDCRSTVSDSIYILLYQPITYNDSIQLVTRIGSDNNTLISACGGQISEFQIVDYVINSCSSSISLTEDDRLTFDIYPNPSHDRITIADPDNELLRYKIFDFTGRCLVRDELSEERHISIGSLKPGRYLLMLEGLRTSSYSSFIKL